VLVSIGAPTLENSSAIIILHTVGSYSSRVVGSRRHAIEPASSTNREHFLWGPYLPRHVQKFVVGVDRPRTRAASALWIDERSGKATRRTNRFAYHFQGSEVCRMAKIQTRTGATQDRRRHLLTVQSGGHRMPLALSQTAPTTRRKTMSGI
jgi:hypothetical protein